MAQIPAPPTSQAPGLPVGYNPATGTVDPTVATGAALPPNKDTSTIGPQLTEEQKINQAVEAGAKQVEAQNKAKSDLYQNNPDEFKKQYPYEYLYRRGYDYLVQGLTNETLKGVDPRLAEKIRPNVQDAVETGLSQYMVNPPAEKPTMYAQGIPIMGEPLEEGELGLTSATKEHPLRSLAADEEARGIDERGLPKWAERREEKKGVASTASGRFASLGGIERRGATSFGRTGGKFGRAVDAAFQVERQHAALEPTEPNANKEMAVGAQNYNTARGAAPISHAAIELPPTERRAEIADAYEAMKHEPSRPEVKRAYDAMKQETLDQYNYATKQLGIKIDFTNKDPYENAEQMQKDVRENHHLSVFTGSGPQGDHPLSEIEPTTGQTYNNIFRATHDLFGYAAGGFDFSERGEENAYNAHRQMYSPEAAKAVRSETQGQSNWFFNNKNVRENPDELGKFAPPKAGLLPEEKTTIEPSPASGESMLGKHESGWLTPNGTVHTFDHTVNTHLSIADKLKLGEGDDAERDALEKGNIRLVGTRAGTVFQAYGNDASTRQTLIKFLQDHPEPNVSIDLGPQIWKSDIPSDDAIEWLENGARASAGNPNVLRRENIPIEPNPATATTHPVLDKLSEKYRTAPVDDRVKYEPTFIRPDGDAIYIGQQTHVGALNSVAPEYKIESDREKFVNDSGAIRVRPQMDAREGDTFHVVVPKSGVTPEQVSALQQMMSKARYGNVIIETADTPSVSKNNLARPEDWQYKSAADIPKILGKLGAMPGQHVAFPEGEYLGGHMPPEERLDLGDLSETQGRKTAPEVQHHEWGHIAAAVASGLPLDNAEIWSINHPDIPRGALAATHFDWTQIPGVKDEGNGVMSMSKDTALALYKQLLQNNVGGGVIEQLIHGTPVFTNTGMSGDMRQAAALLKYLGFSPDEASDAFRNASQTMLQKLNNPKVLSIIKEAAATREEGLPNTHLASTKKVQEVGAKIREALDETEREGATQVNGGGNAAGAERSGEATQPGGAGEVQKGTVAVPAAARTATIEPSPRTATVDWTGKAADMMKDQGSGAIDPRTGKSDTKGVGVEIYPEGRLEKPLKRRPTATDIQEYYDQHKDIFEKNPELRIGWDHTKSGWELNIGASGTEPGATLVGRRLDQRAAWDIANKREIPTGGTGTKTQFKSYPLEQRLADLTGRSVESLPAEIRDNPHLMDDEKTILASKPTTVDEYEDMRRQLPSPEELAETAKAGIANRYWYDRARKAFDTLAETAPKGAFKEGDRDRFAAAFAATSPQQDPNLNLRDALDVYKAWLDEGRPTDEKRLSKISNQILKLEAHIPNTARAFTDRPLSGPKVSSFLKNLTGNVSNVTNDMWGAVTNGVDPNALSKPGAYIALSENYRRAAQLLGWTPEQAQAASWGFVRTLGNVSGWKGQSRWLPPQEVLPFIDDPLVRQYSADVADIMLTDPDVRARMEELGVNLNEFDTKLKAATETLERGGTGKTEGLDTALFAKTAKRVDEAKQRAKEQLEQGKRVAGKMRHVLNRNMFEEGEDLQLPSIAQRVANIKEKSQ